MEYIQQNRFEKFAKILLYFFGAMLPLWFVPWPFGTEGGREVSFIVILLAAAILWLLSVLSTGEFRFQLSPLIYASGLLALIFGVSTFLSKTPMISALLADPAGERFSILIIGLLTSVMVGGMFKKMEEVGTFVFIIIFSSAASALINILQLLFRIPVYGRISQMAQGFDFNVIGTQNGLAIFYSVILAMTLGIITSFSVQKWKAWVRTFLIISTILFVANLMLIGFKTAWVMMLAAAIFLFGLVAKNMARQIRNGIGTKRFDWRSWLSLGFLTLGIIMLLVNRPLTPNLNLPSEISPSFRGTLSIGFSVFKEGAKSVFFGSGPGTFGLDWNEYKDPSINQTPFWNLRFNQGSSWLTTLAPTAGILGILTFLSFVIVALISFLKEIFSSKKEDLTLSTTLFLGFISLVIAASLYPATLSLVLLFFLLAGLLTAYLSGHPKEKINELGEKEVDIWAITEKKISFSSPWSVFISSLVVIFLISLGVTALYLQVDKIRAALAMQKAVNYLNQGKLDEGITELEKMTALDDGNYRNFVTLAQIRNQKINNLIQQASAGQNVQQEFQGNVSLAIQYAQKAIQLNPLEPSIWRIQGALYETIIPFIQGAERFAFSSYQQATQLDPYNPSIWIDLGRAGMAFADRLRALENNASASEKDQLEKLRVSVLGESQKAMQTAADMKPDYAAAHFLLAQAALRLGDSQAAIRSAENAKLSAPFDIGVAFQLGLLYYQTNDLPRAQAEFERTIQLNPNYSNARYFLGLVYDRRGNRGGALEQFQQVLALNPDNQEVKNIITNLQKNKSALAGIAPPGTPPEKRSSAPVEEKGKKN